nr:MAG TPA: hypothetical protein [Caudoviricetes sp.]
MNESHLNVDFIASENPSCEQEGFLYFAICS